MTTTYNTNSEAVTHLDALEIMDWGVSPKNKPVLALIKHMMEASEGYTIHVSITQSKTIVTLMSYGGEAIKTLVLRHWLNSYAGVQVIGGGAFALINDEWINL